MNYTKQQLWERFQKYCFTWPELKLSLDLSRMLFDEKFFPSMEGKFQTAFKEMDALEKGAIANADEKRMVGHYWLRDPQLAPSDAIRSEIDEMLASVKRFTADVHSGKVRGASGPFKYLLLIGIGGSALGPQFVSNALGQPGSDKMILYCLDNTDPDGMDRVFAQLEGKLGQTLCVVISKSGGTKETRNGMVEAEMAFREAGLSFAAQTVAITSKGSDLDKHATENPWLARFPMWDWVGGRTSELSAVGLLPAALQGFDIDGLLSGAKACDIATRQAKLIENPAALLAAMWHYSGNGKGEKNMVVLPYKDRLELFSKYLQQLIMESLGKQNDRSGQVVNQGITVLGNKGSTDQHSYVQQLREGLSNFFVTFIQVLRDRKEASSFVEPGITTGDFLNGFLLGTREALFENGRESITITVAEVSPFSVGVLIALFERTVGLYASVVNVNAYHQPGVEAGKKAAASILKTQELLTAFLAKNSAQSFSAQELAHQVGVGDAEIVFKLCQHLASNSDRHVRQSGARPTDARFQWVN